MGSGRGSTGNPGLSDNGEGNDVESFDVVLALITKMNFVVTL